MVIWFRGLMGVRVEVGVRDGVRQAIGVRDGVRQAKRLGTS